MNDYTYLFKFVLIGDSGTRYVFESGQVSENRVS